MTVSVPGCPLPFVVKFFCPECCRPVQATDASDFRFFYGADLMDIDCCDHFMVVCPSCKEEINAPKEFHAKLSEYKKWMKGSR